MSRGERSTKEPSGAPSWQDYIDALKIEGRRFRPVSLRAVLEKREREAGKPRASDEGQK